MRKTGVNEDVTGASQSEDSSFLSGVCRLLFFSVKACRRLTQREAAADLTAGLDK